MTAKATTTTPDATAPAPAHAVPAADLPQTREGLLERHAELRARRNAAVLGGPEWHAAVEELGRVEVEVARLERAMDPPQV